MSLQLSEALVSRCATLSCPAVPSKSAHHAGCDCVHLLMLLCAALCVLPADAAARWRLDAPQVSALRSARLPVNLIGSPINYANRLIGSPITSQSTVSTPPARIHWLSHHGCAGSGRGLHFRSHQQTHELGQQHEQEEAGAEAQPPAVHH